MKYFIILFQLIVLPIFVYSKVFLTIVNDKKNMELIIYGVNTDSVDYFIPDTVSLSFFKDTLIIEPNMHGRNKDGRVYLYFTSNSYLPPKMIKLKPGEIFLRKIHYKKLKGIEKIKIVGLRLYNNDFDINEIKYPNNKSLAFFEKYEKGSSFLYFAQIVNSTKINNWLNSLNNN